jgi:hypothetical protein
MLSLVIAASIVLQQPKAEIASPAKQQAIMAQIKAERAAKDAKPGAAATKPATPVSPSDVSPKAKAQARRAAWRAHNARQEALEAARQAQQRREALMLLPYQLKAQEDMLRYQADIYAADQRLRGDRALANGFAGVSTPPY